MRRDQIDILIDLGGHTGNSQIHIMALCPAPIQVAAILNPACSFRNSAAASL
jgi:protein O-GlcNAc transferase